MFSFIIVGQCLVYRTMVKVSPYCPRWSVLSHVLECCSSLCITRSFYKDWNGQPVTKMIDSFINRSIEWSTTLINLHDWNWMMERMNENNLIGQFVILSCKYFVTIAISCLYLLQTYVEVQIMKWIQFY